MPQPAPSPSSASTTDSDRRAPGRPLLRAVLVAGVVVTVLSGLALLAALLAYFLEAPASPLLFGLALDGLPTGFALLVLHLVLSAVGRSRL